MSKNRIFIILMMLVLVFGISMSQAQEKEDKLELNVLENGEVVEDFLSGEVQTRIYVFNALEGDTVTIAMNALDEELDPFLVLLGPAGEVITRDDDGGDGYSSLIYEQEVPSTGLYFIVASSFVYINSILEPDSDAELAYELTLNGVSKLKGDDAKLIYYHGDLVDGQKIRGASTEAEPVFYFTFEGSKGDVIDLSMSSDDFDTVLHLFAPGGERIAINDDAYGTNSAIEGFELTEDGVYLVFATDVFFYLQGLEPEDEDSLLVFKGGEFEIELSFR